MFKPSSAACAITGLLALNSTVSAQCTGSTIDILQFPRGSVAFDARGRNAAVAPTQSLLDVTRIEAFRATNSASIDFVYESTIQPSHWETWWDIGHLAVEGDVVAHQLRAAIGVGSINLLEIHERTSTEWASTSIPLSAPNWLSEGPLVDVDGGRVASVRGGNFIGTVLELDVFEKRGAPAAWTLADTVRIDDIGTPYFDYPAMVSLEGDIAAVAAGWIFDSDRVAVCEPDINGDWRQTALLLAPNPSWQTQSVHVSGGEVWVHRWRSGVPFENRLDVYARPPGGAWILRSQTDLEALPGIDQVTKVKVDRGRAVCTGRALWDSIDFVLEPATSGVLQVTRILRGSDEVLAVDGERVFARANLRVRAAIAAPNAGAVIDERYCQQAGRSTCAGSGPPTLTMYEEAPFASGMYLDRRVIAEIASGAPGSVAILFRSPNPAVLPGTGLGLCIERQSAAPVAAASLVGPQGRVTFPVSADESSTANGFTEAVHFQAVVRSGSGAFSLTNAVAWLP